MKSIDDYLAEHPEVFPRLSAVRETIRKAIPEAEERISWGMPTYWKLRNIIHFAAAKKHIGIYPGPDAIVAFADELKDYRTSKGAIQLPNAKELPLDLIRRIAIWCWENNSVS